MNQGFQTLMRTFEQCNFSKMKLKEICSSLVVVQLSQTSVCVCICETSRPHLPLRSVQDVKVTTAVQCSTCQTGGGHAALLTRSLRCLSSEKIITTQDHDKNSSHIDARHLCQSEWRTAEKDRLCPGAAQTKNKLIVFTSFGFLPQS